MPIPCSAERVAQLLRAVDSAKVTTNLWGERWSKLVANTMTTGICGVTGFNLNEIVLDKRARRLQMRLAAEAIRVGHALGFKLVAIRGVEPEQWLAADAGESAALRQVEAHMLEAVKLRPQGGWSSTAQDIAKGRRTEVEFMNGYVAARGADTGVPTPTHATMATLVEQVERGEIIQAPANLALFSTVPIPA
jgi:2-dehydropantoate 2-reductase